MSATWRLSRAPRIPSGGAPPPRGEAEATLRLAPRAAGESGAGRDRRASTDQKPERPAGTESLVETLDLFWLYWRGGLALSVNLGGLARTMRRRASSVDVRFCALSLEARRLLGATVRMDEVAIAKGASKQDRPTRLVGLAWGLE